MRREENKSVFYDVGGGKINIILYTHRWPEFYGIRGKNKRMKTFGVQKKKKNDKTFWRLARKILRFYVLELLPRWFFLVKPDGRSSTWVCATVTLPPGACPLETVFGNIINSCLIDVRLFGRLLNVSRQFFIRMTFVVILTHTVAPKPIFFPRTRHF